MSGHPCARVRLFALRGRRGRVRKEPTADPPIPLSTVTAVVLNWRTPGHTARAVRALVADGVPADRVVVVDNGSGDGSHEVLAEALPGCPILALPANVGYARGNNLGAAALPGSAYLLVNSDAFVHRAGSVQVLLDALRDTATGLAVPRVLNPDLSLQGTVAPLRRPSTALVRATGVSRLVPNRLQPSWSIFWDHRTSRHVEYAAGPVVAVRADAWDALGGFDERIEMYTEDVDLCWRARRSGYRLWFAADAEFIHLGNASGVARWDELERWRRMARAEADLIRRHLSPRRARATIGITRAGLRARSVVHRISGNTARRRVVEASIDGYRG